MKNTTVVKENVLYVFNLIVSILVLYLIIRLIAATDVRKSQYVTMLITYLVLIIVYVFFAKGLMIGHFRGNGVRVSEHQFPEIHSIYVQQLQKLGIRAAPSLYCVQSNGVLNAFATRMAFRNYVVLYSEVLGAAFEHGESAVAYILAHELGHVKRLHLLKSKFIFFSFLLFPLRLAYSRSCEYTCDGIAKTMAPGGEVDGLLMLAAGRRLASRINVPEYLEKAGSEKGFWVWFAEFMSTHPNLPKRIRRMRGGA
jgi:Zn-dependent protease with chaperone function